MANRGATVTSQTELSCAARDSLIFRKVRLSREVASTVRVDRFEGLSPRAAARSGTQNERYTCCKTGSNAAPFSWETPLQSGRWSAPGRAACGDTPADGWPAYFRWLCDGTWCRSQIYGGTRHQTPAHDDISQSSSNHLCLRKFAIGTRRHHTATEKKPANRPPECRRMPRAPAQTNALIVAAFPMRKAQHSSPSCTKYNARLESLERAAARGDRPSNRSTQRLKPLRVTGRVYGKLTNPAQRRTVLSAMRLSPRDSPRALPKRSRG